MLYHEFPATVNHLSQCWSLLPYFFSNNFTVCLLPSFLPGWQREKGKVSDQQWWSDKLYQEASAGGRGLSWRLRSHFEGPQQRIRSEGIRWWCHQTGMTWLTCDLIHGKRGLTDCSNRSMQKGREGADVSRKIVISLMIWLAFFLDINFYCLFFTTQHFVITCFSTRD